MGSKYIVLVLGEDDPTNEETSTTPKEVLVEGMGDEEMVLEVPEIAPQQEGTERVMKKKICK